jgi:hypothetical protein
MAELQEGAGAKVELSILGKASIEFLRHREPALIAFLGMHHNRGFELGVGIGSLDILQQKLRMDLGLRAIAFGTRFSRDAGAVQQTGFRPTPFVDVAVSPSWNGSVLQQEISVGVLSELPVGVPRAFDWDLVATRIGIEGGMTLIALQRIYLKANYAHFLHTGYSSGASTDSAQSLEKNWTADLTLGIRALFR